MNLDDILQTVKDLVNNERVATLALSKGGWEGWLQVELWYSLTFGQNQSVEREVNYPKTKTKTKTKTKSSQRCDLVVGNS